MNCPICNKILLNAQGDWFCQTRISLGKTNVPHYERRGNESPTWYVPPYKIMYGDGKSRIFTVDDKNPGDKYHKPDFKFLMELNEEIHPDNADKVAKRIKNLIIFS